MIREVSMEAACGLKVVFASSSIAFLDEDDEVRGWRDEIVVVGAWVSSKIMCVDA